MEYKKDISPQDKWEEIKPIESFALFKEIATLTYENENTRDITMKTQASSLQAAFSFLSATIAVLIPVIVEHRGTLSLTYLFIVFCSIFAALLLSLFFATLSQLLRKQDTFLTISELETDLKENYDSFNEINDLTRYYADLLDKQHKSRRNNNSTRSKYINYSIKSFVVALCLCVFWFIVSIIILSLNI